jgi:queuine tRNA-ribosyltransferase
MSTAYIIMKKLTVKGKSYRLPIYLPDATRAVAKCVDTRDLLEAGIEGCVVNTYHLQTDPGISVIKKFHGVKKFMNFNGFVASDSGGWQIYSLIQKNKNSGTVTDKGVSFSRSGGGAREIYTPEKCVEDQFELRSDVIVCLDHFSEPGNSESDQESVDRTVLWAERSKARYMEIIKEKGLDDSTKPLIFAVIQGGEDMELRKTCAQKLQEIGFDGYGFGGYLVDEGTGKLNLALMEKIANIIPDQFCKFALGVGTPHEITMCSKYGWNIFDCTLPTRDARNGRLYIYNKNPVKREDLENEVNHGYLYITRDEFRRDERPVSEFCDCYTCKNYSRAYLNHLFSIEDTLSERLATIHNLRVFSKTVEVLRGGR